ncbi:hypothetical protein ANN_21640 [Periplaneta americana]|uniref:Uncharacterized protein n=1 Tax=Periplaneta americana TaxID=6978 RepID=A0ABQ8S6M6_PERAM|nr:hypothetical protein ANN_21640 [Periplaneta americana]
MAGLCEGGNEPPGSLKSQSLAKQSWPVANPNAATDDFHDLMNTLADTSNYITEQHVIPSCSIHERNQTQKTTISTGSSSKTNTFQMGTQTLLHRIPLACQEIYVSIFASFKHTNIKIYSYSKPHHNQLA